MEVFSSTDGVLWNSEGIYSGNITSSSSSATNPELKTIKFYSSVNGRFFRFHILTSSSNYTRVGEVNVIN